MRVVRLQGEAICGAQPSRWESPILIGFAALAFSSSFDGSSLFPIPGQGGHCHFRSPPCSAIPVPLAAPFPLIAGIAYHRGYRLHGGHHLVSTAIASHCHLLLSSLSAIPYQLTCLPVSSFPSYPPTFVIPAKAGIQIPLSTKIIVEINPFRVLAHDQANFPRPIPFLELLFPGDRSRHSFMHFVINQQLDSISFTKPLDQSFLMLPDPCKQIAGYTDIERSIGSARENVDTRLLHCCRRPFGFPPSRE